MTAEHPKPDSYQYVPHEAYPTLKWAERRAAQPLTSLVGELILTSMAAIAKNVSLLERHARLLNWFRSPAGGYTSDAEVFRDALDALAEKRRTEAARDFYRIFGETAGPGLSDNEEAALSARCRPKGRAE